MALEVRQRHQLVLAHRDLEGSLDPAGQLHSYDRVNVELHEIRNGLGLLPRVPPQPREIHDDVLDLARDARSASSRGIYFLIRLGGS
jgi:hypothetical protein